jgi:hypothetical protein
MKLKFEYKTITSAIPTEFPRLVEFEGTWPEYQKLLDVGIIVSKVKR